MLLLLRAFATTLAAFCIFTDTKLEWQQSGWFGFAFTALRAVTVTHLARFAAANSSAVHRMRLVKVIKRKAALTGALDPSPAPVVVIANASVDMGAADRQLDALGFVYGPLGGQKNANGVALEAGEQYYVLSEEGPTAFAGASSAGDPYYGLADPQPCIGHAGPGGTLPRMNVPTDAIRIDGGVSTTDITGLTGPFELLADFEPRAFGPTTFLFQEGAKAEPRPHGGA